MLEHVAVTESLKQDFSLHEYKVKTEADEKALLVSCFVLCMLSATGKISWQEKTPFYKIPLLHLGNYMVQPTPLLPAALCAF